MSNQRFMIVSSNYGVLLKVEANNEARWGVDHRREHYVYTFATAADWQAVYATWGLEQKQDAGALQLLPVDVSKLIGGIYVDVRFRPADEPIEKIIKGAHIEAAAKAHCIAMERMLSDLGNEMRVPEIRTEAMRLALMEVFIEPQPVPVITGFDMGVPGGDRSVSQLVWAVRPRPCTEYPNEGLEVLVFNPGPSGMPAVHYWRRMYRRDGHWILNDSGTPYAVGLDPHAVWINVPPAPPTQQPVDPGTLKNCPCCGNDHHGLLVVKALTGEHAGKDIIQCPQTHEQMLVQYEDG